MGFEPPRDSDVAPGDWGPPGGLGGGGGAAGAGACQRQQQQQQQQKKARARRLQLCARGVSCAGR
eukprot:1380375-Prymnesium_polylepis.1